MQIIFWVLSMVFFFINISILLKTNPLLVKFSSLVSKDENWLITKSKEFIDYVNDTFILI